MDLIDLIAARYPDPGVLGLTTAGEVRALISARMPAGESLPLIAEATALYYLLDTEISILLQKREKVRIEGELSVEQGIAERLAGLERQQRRYAITAGIVQQSSVQLIGGNVTWIPQIRRR